MLSADGSVGDVIGISNAGGQGQILFWSDPTLPPSLTALGPFLGVLCTESVSSGCIETFALTTTNGTILTINVASDGEQVFDRMALTLSPMYDRNARVFGELRRGKFSATDMVWVAAFAFAAQCVRAVCPPGTGRSV